MRENFFDGLRFIFKTREANVGHVQQRCSAWFHNMFKPKLALLIVQFEHESDDDVIQIERLSLDLGEIPLAQFEIHMQERALAELARQLRVIVDNRPMLNEAINLDQLDDYATEHDVVKSFRRPVIGVTSSRPNTPASLRINEERASMDELASLLTYLDTGYLAQSGRWHNPDDPDRRVVDWLARNRNLNTPTARIEVALRCLNPRARHRLMTTFTDATLLALIAWMTAPWAVEVPVQSSWSRLLPLIALKVLQQYPSLARVSASRLPATSRSLPHRLADGQRVLASSTNNSSSPRGDAAEEALLRDLLSAPLIDPVRSQLINLLATTPGTVSRATSWLAELSPTLRLKPTHKRPPSTDPPPAPRQANERRIAVPESEEPLAVPTGGLVLLWPMLPRLFEALELIREAKFVDEAARYRAVTLLDWLAFGVAPAADWRLPVSRVLCGLAPLPDESEPLEWPSVDVATQTYLDSWLNSTLSRLPALSRLSVNDLRELFLQRPGSLIRKNEHWHLAVEHEAQDMLLRGLPWPLTIVALPWLSQPLPVEWND